jgi:hypothetical protein
LDCFREHKPAGGEAVTHKILDKCPDFVDCHFILKGLPPCLDGCNIRIAKNNERLWGAIKRQAAYGNAASREVIKRGDRM